MPTDRRQLLWDILLYSGLGCFSYFFLVRYADIPLRQQDRLLTPQAFVAVMLLFNGVGLGMRYTLQRMRRSYPTFLDSLNTLIAEIEYNPQGAVGFTRNLSDVYRYILVCQDKRLVSLREEMEFVNTYVELHRVRLGDCLTVDWHMDEKLAEAQLPPLTLQLLVENIVKHNVISLSRPMTMTVEAVADDNDGSTWLRVSNPIHPKLGALTGGKDWPT